MKKLILLFSIITLLATPALAEIRIGVVDLGRAMAESEVGKATQAKIDNDKKAFLQKMKGLEEELVKLQDEFKNQAAMMKPGARADKQAEIEKKYLAAQQTEQKEAAILDRKIQEQVVPLQKNLLQVAQDLAKQDGYDFVFERGSMIHAIDAADFTDKVIAQANKKLKK